MKKTKKKRNTAQKQPAQVRLAVKLRTCLAHKWVLPSIAGVLILTVAGVLLFSWFTRPTKPGIAFYRVPETMVEAITQRAQDPLYTSDTEFTFYRFDDSLPLQGQLEKQKNRVSILFAPIGQAAASLSSDVDAPAKKIRQLLPTTIRNAGKSGKDIYALPLLLDHYELSSAKTILAEAGVQKPVTLTEMITTARAVKSRKVWPIICAGGQDNDLLLLVGTLLDSQMGVESYMKLVKGLRDDADFEYLLSETGLETVLETLLSWRRERLLHPQWLEMTNADLDAFMRFDSAAYVFMPLSTKRTLDQKTADKYESSAFPREKSQPSYPLTAPVYSGIRIRNELFADSAETFLYSLADDEAQSYLSRVTGLAPANAKAPPHDIEAYNVRLWAASSRVLLPDPVTAAVDDPSRISSFAEQIRDYIKNGGKLIQ